MYKKIVSYNFLVQFCDDLALLLEKGLTIPECLEFLKCKEENLINQSYLDCIESNIEEGKPLSEVLESSKLFPKYLINMIKFGEELGTVPKVLLGVSDYYQALLDYHNSLDQLIIVPSLTLMTAVTMVYFNFKLFPNLYGAIKNVLHMQSNITSLLDNIFVFNRIFSVVLILVVLLMMLFILLLKKSKIKLKRFGFMQNFEIYTVADILSNALSSGVHIRDAIELCSKFSGNKRVNGANSLLDKGYSLGQIFSELKIFSEYETKLLDYNMSIGDVSDTLSIVASNNYKMFKTKLNIFIDNLVMCNFIIILCSVLSIAVVALICLLGILSVYM